jgi:hypothetical protein
LEKEDGIDFADYHFKEFRLKCKALHSMDLRFYIPIFQHLKPTDIDSTNIKEKDKFTFEIFSQSSQFSSFSIYKSLAYFLSNKAYQLVKVKKSL